MKKSCTLAHDHNFFSKLKLKTKRIDFAKLELLRTEDQVTISRITVYYAVNFQELYIMSCLTASGMHFIKI